MRLAGWAFTALLLVGCSGGHDGARLPDGLLLPSGVRLIGPIFRYPSGTWTAVGAIEGDDPIRAWDRLAARSATAGHPVGGSGQCTWEANNRRSPMASGQRQPTWARAIRCGDSLRWGDDPWAGSRFVTFPLSGDQRVTSRAEVDLRSLRSLSRLHVGAGERLGSYLPCTSFETYLRVPAGSTLEALTTDAVDFTAVLATSDADATLADLLAQIRRGDSPEDAPQMARIERHQRGQQHFAELTAEDDAGGGGCSALASPDRRWVLVKTYSD